MQVLEVNIGQNGQLEMSRADWANLMSGSARDFGVESEAWMNAGYPAHPSIALLRSIYERSGFGGGAVDMIAGGVWQGAAPKFVPVDWKDGDPETKFERDIAKLLERHWRAIKLWDIRASVGYYAGLVLRIGDNRSDLSTPPGRGALLGVIPCWQDQLLVTARNEDMMSPDYGAPSLLSFHPGAVTAPGEASLGALPTMQIHGDRVVLWASGGAGVLLTDGRPPLLRALNACLALAKIVTGASEKARMDTARTVLLVADANVNLSQLAQSSGKPATPEGAKEAANDLVQAANASPNKGLLVGGLKPEVLQTAAFNPREYLDVALAELCAAFVGLSQRQLTGTQQGVTSGAVDMDTMRARFEELRENDKTPMLEALVRKLQKLGIAPAGEFRVVWPPLESEDLAKQVEALKGLAQAAASLAAQRPNDPLLMSTRQMLEVVGMEVSEDAAPTPEPAPREPALPGVTGG